VRTAIVLFTRDLRVHDNLAFSTAAHEAERIVPLFVFDDAILGSAFGRPNRVAFLLDALGDHGRAQGRPEAEKQADRRAAERLLLRTDASQTTRVKMSTPRKTLCALWTAMPIQALRYRFAG